MGSKLESYVDDFGNIVRGGDTVIYKGKEYTVIYISTYYVNLSGNHGGIHLTFNFGKPHLKDGVQNSPPTSKIKTDGGSSAYCDAPFQEFTTVNDMVDYYSKNFWGWRSYIFKDIMKAVTRFGRKEGTDESYDSKKIIYYGCRLLMSVTDKATTRKYLQQLLDDKQFKENE